MKRIPILPTLIVLIAVGIMVRLGFWQMDRLQAHGLRGVFCRGRTRNVESEISAGVRVPMGTIRCRLVMALIEQKQAVLIPENEFW